MPPDADPTQRINLAELLAPHMDLPDPMAVAALDQMSWHLFCCYYPFNGPFRPWDSSSFDAHAGLHAVMTTGRG